MSAKRKSIQHYRDRGVKTPAVAYLFDRSYVYIPVVAVALLAMLAVIVAGFKDLSAMAAPPEGSSPYRETEPRDFLGMEFAEDIVSKKPEGIDSDDWDSEGPTQPSVLFSAEQCPELGSPPKALITTYEGSGGGLTFTARIFGAGQAKAHFQNTVDTIEDCEDVEDFSSDELTVSHDDTDYSLSRMTFSSSGEEHVLFTAGDAIFEVNVGDDSDVSGGEAADFYADYAVESLNREQWQCLDIDYSSSASQRSFFYGLDSYEGLTHVDELTAETETGELPTPTLTKQGNDSASSVIDTVSEPNSEKPEAPLPDDFESIPENSPDRPELPLEFEKRNDFSADAEYKIPDHNGPGCGWAWSAQVSPIYDESALEHNREVVRTKVQNGLERDAGEYLNSGFSYSLRVLNEEPVITRWNEHVNTVDGIHEDWRWLEEEREALRPLWDRYLANHEEWTTFPDRQDDARDEYEDARQQCIDQRDAVNEWEEEYGEAVENGEAVIEGSEDDGSNAASIAMTGDQESPSDSPSASDEESSEESSGGDDEDSENNGNDGSTEEESSDEPSEEPSSSPTPSPSDDDDEEGNTEDDDSEEDSSDEPSESPSNSPTPSPSDDDDENNGSDDGENNGNGNGNNEESEDAEEEEDLPTVPERPEDCDTMPDRPSILDEERGDEPQPPEVPEGVTVPNSWEDPAGEDDENSDGN